MVATNGGWPVIEQVGEETVIVAARGNWPWPKSLVDMLGLMVMFLILPSKDT